MVDWVKLVKKVAELHPGEELLGGAQITPSPFAAAGAGMTGGMIAGGAIGAAIGAAADKRRERKIDEDAAARATPEIARRPAAIELSRNGVIVGVSAQRLLVYGFTGMGKAKDLLLERPIGDVESVVTQSVEGKAMRGQPASTLIWIGFSDGSALAGAMISQGAAGKANRSLLEGVEQVRPGTVTAFG